MRSARALFLKYGAIVIGSLFVGLIVFFRVFHAYELISYDLRFKLRPTLAASGDIVIIEISDDTLKNLNLWPLPRDFHASLVDVLREAGAKMIVFDVLFSEPTVYDETFAASIKKQGHVYLPVALDMRETRGGRLPLPKVDGILSDLIPALKSAVAGSGYINVFIDPDGKTRMAPLFVDYNGALVPSMVLKAACDLMRLDVNKAAFYRDKVIIDGAHLLSLEASNALLKILEEPELSVVFLLISSAPENVLPTIKSRAVPLRFNFATQAELMKVKGSTEELAKYAMGRSGVLVQLIQDPEFRKTRQQLFKYAGDVYKGGVAKALTASKELADRPEERLILVEDMLKFLEDDLIKSPATDFPLFRRKLAHFLEALRLEATTNVNPRLAADHVLSQLQSPYNQVT